MPTKTTKKKKMFFGMFTLFFSALLILGAVLAEELAEIRIRSIDSDGRLVTGIRYTIKDESGNPLKFRVAGNNEYQVSPSGTYLQVTSGEDDIKITGVPLGNYTVSDSGEGTFVSDERSQTVRIDKEDILSVDFHFPKNTGAIKVLLQSEAGENLKGRSFFLKGANNNKLLFSQKIEGMEYSENVGTSDLKTRDDGTLYLFGIPYGDYLLEQNLAEGEYVSNPYKQYITINSKDPKSIHVINKPIRQFGDLAIIVKNEVDEPVSASSFEIIDKSGIKIPFDGTSYSKDSNVSSFTIPESGKLELKGIPVGDYTLRQIITPFPYSKVNDIPFKVEVTKQNVVQVLQKISYGELEITKVDEISSQAIQGHKFSIMGKEDGAAIKFLKTDQGYVFDKAGNETVLITDASGIISIKKIPGMTVLIKEIEPANNYLPNEEVVEKTIRANEKTTYISKSKKPSVILETRSKSGEIVPKVSIEVIDKNNELIFSRASNEQGEIEFSDLTEGEYRIQIKEVPEGFCFPKESKEFKVEKDGSIVGLSDFFIPEVTIIASLAEPGVSSFEGGRFVLFRDGEKYAEEETGKEGYVRFTRLPYGKYSIKQIAAPMGLDISDKEFNFVVDKNYVNGEAYLFAEGGTPPEEGEEASVENTDPSDLSEEEKRHTESSKTEEPAKKSVLPYILFGFFALVFIVAAVFIVKNSRDKGDEEEISSNEKKSEVSSIKEKEEDSFEYEEDDLIQK